MMSERMADIAYPNRVTCSDWTQEEPCNETEGCSFDTDDQECKGPGFVHDHKEPFGDFKLPIVYNYGTDTYIPEGQADHTLGKQGLAHLFITNRRPGYSPDTIADGRDGPWEIFPNNEG